MGMIANLIGGSIGFLPNPVLLLFAFFAAKYTPKESKFWLFFVFGVVCGYLFNIILAFTFDGGMPATLAVRLMFYLPLSMVWASIFFLAVRMPWRKRRDDEGGFLE
jgi:hypothetical protein